jgi:hypothetical protein
MRNVLPIVILSLLAGCEQQASAPAGGASTGQAQSQLGRTVEMAKDVRDQIQARDAQLGTAAAQAAGAALGELPGLAYTPPEGWTAVTPGNAMRLAEFEAGGATVVLSTAGGSVDANIDRWLGQIVDQNGAPVGAESREDRPVAGLDATVIESYGAYLDGTGMGGSTRRENYGLIGAVVQTPGQLTFIKMTGPADRVEAQRGAFTRLLDSMRAR